MLANMRGINIDDLPEKYREQVRQQLAPTVHVPRPTPDVESDTGDAPLGPQEATGYCGQVDVVITEKRHRLADPDGSSCKFLLDSLVDSKVLRGDSAKEIREVKKSQVKIATNEKEETIVEIYKV